MIDVDELQRAAGPSGPSAREAVAPRRRVLGAGSSDGRGGPEEGIDLLATYAGQAPLLKEWSQGAQINTDRNLRLQYLAGMSVEFQHGRADPVEHPCVLPLPRPDIRRLATSVFAF